MAKKKTKTPVAIGLAVGVTFAYFMWLFWQKITTIIGNSDTVLLICAGILVLAYLTGHFTTNKIIDRFM